MNRRQADLSHRAASLKEQQHVVACVAGWARFALGGRRRVVGYRPPIGAGDRLASFVTPSILRALTIIIGISRGCSRAAFDRAQVWPQGLNLFRGLRKRTNPDADLS